MPERSRGHSGTRKSAGEAAKKQAAAVQASGRERIWQVVALIPHGKVASYGQVARLAELPRHARLVGRTLSDLPPDSTLPWHRVVNASLKISLRRGSGGEQVQRRRLEAEGVEFIGERIAKSFRWEAGL